MGLEDLNEVDILNSALFLIFVAISLIIGIKILLKYFTYNRKVFITVGLTWIFLSSGWWGVSISFLGELFFNTRLAPFHTRVIGRIFLPFAIICWIYSFSVLVYPSLKTKIISIYSVICFSYEGAFIIILIVNPDFIGTTVNIGTFSIAIFLFNIFSIFTTIITGILFTRKSMESDDKKTQWKGRFLILAFISFTIGSTLEVMLFLNPPEILRTIVRVILISSTIEYYLGFFLPDRLATWLIKED
ncbi:MAG: hypothetical protein ACTSRI_21110 [Promethearchaeota archaeon]